jgi:hypothetical protein
VLALPQDVIQFIPGKPGLMMYRYQTFLDLTELTEQVYRRHPASLSRCRYLLSEGGGRVAGPGQPTTDFADGLVDVWILIMFS